MNRTFTDSEQGASLRNTMVELLVDDQVVGKMTTPGTFPNHLFVADFGTISLGEDCETCVAGDCVPGRFDAGLSEDSLGSIGLGRAGPEEGSMKFRLPILGLADGAAKADSFQYLGLGSGPVEVIDEPGQGRRQVKSASGLVDVTDNYDGSTYTDTEIKFYESAGTKSGGYYPGATLTKTIRFEHEYEPVSGQPPETHGTDFLTVSEIDAEGTKTTTYEYNRATKVRSLVTAAGQRKESQATTTSGSTRTVSREVRSGSDTLLQNVNQTFTTFAWGEELTSEVSDPAGVARTTTWTYEDDDAEGGYGQVVAMVDADGYWERYTHYPDGRREKVISQYDGATVGASEANSRVVTTSYDGEDRTEIETLLGQEVARRYHLRSTSGAVTTEQEQVCTVPGAAVDAATNLVTTTVYGANGQTVTHPDGTITKTATSTDGLTTTSETGAASGGAVTDGTKTIVIQDTRGNEQQRTVWDVASNTMILQDTATASDAFGRPTTITHLNGTSEGRTYGCCGLETSTDSEGITTVYGHDDFGNVDSETRAGITIGRVYDALGRLRLLTRTGADAEPITIGGSDYDLAGKETLQRSILGNIGITEVATSGNTWTHTETLPGGATKIRKRTSDGLLKEVSGTAEYPRTYAYEVGSGQRSVTETRIGTGGSTSEWTKETTDAAGRVTAISYPDSAQASSHFNGLGQLWKQVDPDGVTTFFGYNSRGEQTTVTLDVNRNGAADTGEPTTVTTRSVAGGKLQTTVVESGTTVSVSEQNLDNLNRTETRHGLTTSIAVTAGAGARTETATLPDTSTFTRTFTDGRLASEVHAGGSDIARSVSYGYDDRGRLETITDARTGTTTFTYYDTDLTDTITKAGRSVTYGYNALGQRTSEALPGGRSITTGYRATGEVTSVSGNAAYPVSYEHDPQGRMTSMTTATGTTTWQINLQRGWLDSKTDAAAEPVGYTYTDAGRPETRTWARGVTTTYGYDDAGRIASVSYSDGTPSVGFGYDARSRIDSVTDAAGSHAIGYGASGAFASDTISGGALGTVGVANSFDGLLRKDGFAAAVDSSAITAYGWGYDGLSRLQTVTSGNDSATYAYHPNSALVNTLVFKRSGTTRLTTTKTFDALDRLESNLSAPSVGDSTGVTFAYNTAGEIERATLPDGNYWSYGYNDRSELTAATKKLAGDTELSGYQFGFTFDGIGNRLTATRNTRTATYTPNTLNQYVSRTVPGFVNVLGRADESATVTVNEEATTRQGPFFHAELAVANTPDPVYLETIVEASNTEDEAELTGHLFVPATPEAFQYDDDGNTLRDGRWNYTWDGENRLESMVTRADVAAVGAPRQRLTFGYDYLGRRFSKKVEDWDDGEFKERFTVLFAYDGWNVAAEWVQGGGGIPIRSYVWGSDLSGGNAAGGVGGLLWLHQLPEEKAFAIAYDGNGNVTNLTDMADGSTAATYEYGPFGELIRSSGLFARVNPIRFSTKYQDNESDLLYYGYRYYNPELGRWVNRDPIEESGGSNLYGMIGNDPVGRLDFLGLKWKKVGPNKDNSRMLYLRQNSTDTFEELARMVGLDAKEYQKWAIPVAEPASGESNKGGCKYSVPNIWISTNFLDGPTLWEKIVNLGAIIGRPVSDLGPRLSGKKVISTSSAAGLPGLISRHRTDIWGIVIYGHGGRNGYLGDYRGTDFTSQQAVIGTLGGDYKIAVARLMQCFGIYKGWDGRDYQNFGSQWSRVAIDFTGYRHENILGFDIPSSKDPVPQNP